MSSNLFVVFFAIFFKRLIINLLIKPLKSKKIKKTPSPINIGDRYMEATDHFGGVIVDICSEDWSPGVTDASNSLEPHEYWELTHIPSHEETIRVFHDGALNWDWYYEPSTNTVEFTVLPGGNVLVEIAYHYELEDGDDDDSADTGDTGDTGA